MIGRTLNHYRVTAQLGKGGMGEVYAAEDLKLKRNVALKILPPSVAANPERRARFEREAQAVAALSHPNIVTIYSVEEAEGIPFLTMELVEGKTLGELIPRDGLPLDRFLEIAIPLADAIAAAHQQGITHRDLKPGNVMVGHEGRVKVLDFGLAKLREETTVAGDEGTRTAPMTRAGEILGTASYMSPEQADGKPVDTSSDVFSLGIVFYEMVTGRKPFQGDSGARVLASILRDTPPDVTEVNPALPDQLGRIIRHCIEKDPERRPRTALDLRNQLRDLRGELYSGEQSSAAIAATVQPARPAPPRFRVVGLALLVLVAFAAVYVVYDRLVRADRGAAGAPRDGASATRSSDSAFTARKLSQVTFGAELEEWPAWSPDGGRLVYSADKDGFRKLFVKTLSGGEEAQLTRGTNDDIQPDWSPDGARVLFVRSHRADGKLEPGDVLSGWYEYGDVWTIDPDSGEEQILLEKAFNPAFSSDGERIAFDSSRGGPRRIWTADRRGHNPVQVTTDVSEEVAHTQPRWSPDGTKIVFQSALKNTYDIKVVDLATGAIRPITDDVALDLDPVWSPSGSYICFSSYRGGGLNIWRVPVSDRGEPTGPLQQLTTGAGQDVEPAVSPDGTSLAFAVLRQNADLWKLSVSPQTGEPTGPPESVVATTREDSRGAWSPDRTAIAFNSDRDGEMNLWVHSLADGSERPLTRGAGGDYQPDWSPDGGKIAFFSARAGNADIWAVEVADGRLTQLTDSPSLEMNPFHSPDGRRIAYMSDRDGRTEVWVMNADGSDQRQLSATGAGGHFMRWSPDSRYVIYRWKKMHRLPADGGPAEELPYQGGAHISFSPDRSLLMDVSGHKSLWVYPTTGEERRKVFEFGDPDSRIDYPVWSPDGGWVLFDRVAPQGGDVWLLEGLE